MKPRHGMARSRIWLVWQGMRQRCENPRNISYRNYGARGISVCGRWQSFENFYADMGDPGKGYSLDRIDGDGPYSPANCRWATRAEQARNYRNRNVNITVYGVTKCARDWSSETGIAISTLRGRVRNRVPEHLMLCKPNRGNRWPTR